MHHDKLAQCCTCTLVTAGVKSHTLQPNACGLAPSASGMVAQGASSAIQNHVLVNGIRRNCTRSGLTKATPLLPLGSRLAYRIRRSLTTFQQRKILTRQSAPNSIFITAMSSKLDAETQSKAGGSAWIQSGVVLALGGALPGLLLAWRWRQVILHGNRNIKHAFML